jgi:hypothetical protein
MPRHYCGIISFPLNTNQRFDAGSGPEEANGTWSGFTIQVTTVTVPRVQHE